MSGDDFQLQDLANIVCDFYVNAGTRAAILLQRIESKPRLTNLAALPESVPIRDCSPKRLPRSCGQVPVHVSEEWIS